MADALIGGRHDFVFLHVKAVDDTGHDRHPAQKVRLEQITPLAGCHYNPNPAFCSHIGCMLHICQPCPAMARVICYVLPSL